MWYAVIGTIICITFGVIIGLITGNENDKFDERLLHPLIAKISRKMPGKKRTFTSQSEKEVKTDETDDRFASSNSSIAVENNNLPVKTHL